MKTEHDFDVLIVGGGMVGASMACTLGNQNLSVGVIEAFPLRSNSQPSYDARSIALAYGSRRILDSLGIWDLLKNDVTPIKKIHISDQGHFGITRLDNQQEGVEALGYVVENRIIGSALNEKLKQFDNIELVCPAKLINLSIDEDIATVVVEQEANKEKKQRTLTSKLVIAADGGNSAVRKQLDIDAHHWKYGQSAVISTVSPRKPHNNIAYERFTSSGPVALLPLSENRCSLVLTVRDENKEEILALNDEAFLSHLEQRFGFRMGGFHKTAKRIAYPLSMMRAKEHVKKRVVFIGNAAHTVHPIAGQGFNLGLRDVSQLAETLIVNHRSGIDIGALDVLKQYEKRRKPDQLKVAAITDTLARVFSNEFAPLAHMRSSGLFLTDIMPPIKHQVARQAMGITGSLPRLSRGLTI